MEIPQTSQMALETCVWATESGPIGHHESYA